MGYILTGYSSRSLKRKHNGDFLIYYPPITKKLRFEKPVAFLDLPCEIIEYIFILSGNNQLPLINKFLFSCLKPTKFLITKYIWENFIHDLNEYISLPKNKIYLLPSEVFNNKLLFGFLNENHYFFDHIAHIVKFQIIDRLKLERECKFKLNLLEDIDKSHINILKNVESNKPLENFPQPFYSNFDVYFYRTSSDNTVYNPFLLKLHSHFTILKPGYLCEALLYWFFHELHKFNINNLFHAIRLVLYLSNLTDFQLDDLEPLIQLITSLFIHPSSNLEMLLLNNEEDLTNKYCIIDRFLGEFYKNKSNILSENYLWKVLNELNDEILIKLVIDHNGLPSFSSEK